MLEIQLLIYLRTLDMYSHNLAVSGYMHIFIYVCSLERQLAHGFVRAVDRDR